MDDELKEAKAQFSEAAQTIARLLPKHLEQNKACLAIQFPWGVIRPLSNCYGRWPYLSQERKRTVACVIQLCDLNAYHLNVWRVGLTAGTMWEWHCTLPVIAVIETLSYEFGLQHNLVKDGAKFKKTIDTLRSNGVIKQKLSDKLHELREYRNGIHIYLQGKVDMHGDKPRKYNNAIVSLHQLERALNKYWLEKLKS